MGRIRKPLKICSFLFSILVRSLEVQRTTFEHGGEIKKECSSESDITDIDDEHTPIEIASPPQTAAARKAAQNRKIKSTAPYNPKIVYQ